jgi:hypothetical protein
MLESGQAQSLREIAALEGVDSSHVSRMVNQTTLAPDIVDAILLNELPDHLTLFDPAVDPPSLWGQQRLRVDDLNQDRRGSRWSRERSPREQTNESESEPP